MRHVHFIGICGTAMATLAAMLQAARARRAGLGPERLSADEHVPRAGGHRDPHAVFAADHVTGDIDLVVVGNAISRGNPELEEVLDRKIRYCSLPEAIREHFLWGARSIVIAGTHGKTTTTSLAGWLLVHGGLDPERARRRRGRQSRRRRVELSAGLGPRLRDRRRRVRQRVLRQDREVPEVPAGHRRHRQHRVRSRRHLPRISTPCVSRSAASSNLVPRRGLLVLGADSPDAAALDGARRVAGRDVRPDRRGRLARATTSSPRPTARRFRVQHQGRSLGVFEVALVGAHNVKNALAAMAVASRRRRVGRGAAAHGAGGVRRASSGVSRSSARRRASRCSTTSRTTPRP